MFIGMSGGLKRSIAGLAVAMAVLLAGCGGGGGGGEPAPLPPDTSLTLMVDSLGRAVPEADFGKGDPLAAGADGVAFDEGPLANAQVSLVDNRGSTRTATTDASGYYRVDIKDLQLPFVLRVKRPDGPEWFSAGTQSAVTRGFVRININGLTSKLLNYVSDALNIRFGADFDVTPAVLAPNLRLLDPAKARLRVGLAVPLLNAGMDPSSYDPVTTPLAPAVADKHAAFLRSLKIIPNSPGRWAVVGAIVGRVRTFQPVDVAVDGAGSVYLSDSATHSILKIGPAGEVSTLAGSGVAGFADGAGAAAAFNEPRSIALDERGNVYVSDGGNNAIRKVSPAGVVTTLAGGGGTGFADGVGNAARFAGPRGLAVDGNGNVYVADANHALRKITPAGVVSTIAGYTPQQPCCTGMPADFDFSGVAVDGAGNVYVSDFSDLNRRKIFKITPAGVTSNFYVASENVSIGDLSVDSAGNVYLSEGAAVLKITPAGVASTLAGGSTGFTDGNGASARFGSPYSSNLAVDGRGNVFVADLLNLAIRRITPGGDVTTVAGKMATGFTDGPALSAAFSGSFTAENSGTRFVGLGSVAVDAAGDIYVADTGNHAIRRISRNGIVSTVAGTGSPGFANGNGRSASFNRPVGIALDGSGNIYVADSRNNMIRKISASGDVTTLAGSGVAGLTDGVASSATFFEPSYVAVGPDGTVYVTDYGDAIRTITTTGIVSTLTVGDRAHRPSGAIAVDRIGTVFVRTAGGVLYAKSGAGTFANVGSLGGVTPDEGLAVDADGNFYYLLSKTNPLDKLYLIRQSPESVLTRFEIGALQFSGVPGTLAVDSSGNVLVVDPRNATIRIVLP